MWHCCGASPSKVAPSDDQSITLVATLPSTSVESHIDIFAASSAKPSRFLITSIIAPSATHVGAGGAESIPHPGGMTPHPGRR
jgi:hypothetical protein